MTVVTRAVAATAYRNLDDARAKLTHAVDEETGTPLCKRVKAESILDDSCATDENAPASCPLCAKRDPRDFSAPAVEPAPAAQHFFASTFIAWHVAETREEAIKGAVRRSGKTLVDAQKPNGGIEVISYLVPLALDAEYEISYYRPQVAGLRDVQKHKVAGLNAKPVLVEPS